MPLYDACYTGTAAQILGFGGWRIGNVVNADVGLRQKLTVAGSGITQVASTWKIAAKHRLGKLPIGREAIRRVNEQVAADCCEHLPVTYLHAVRAGAYPHDHSDPFDRMVAAQSSLESAILISRDPVFQLFDTQVLW